MGKKSKTKDKDKNKEEDEYIEEQTCDICFDTILFGYYKKKDFSPDNATVCENGHALCMECIKKIIKPKNYLCDDDENCCGFYYTCPICRIDACVGRHQTFSILKGSHKESRKQFIISDIKFNRQDASADEIDQIANRIFERLELN